MTIEMVRRLPLAVAESRLRPSLDASVLEPTPPQRRSDAITMRLMEDEGQNAHVERLFQRERLRVGVMLILGFLGRLGDLLGGGVQ